MCVRDTNRLVARNEQGGMALVVCLIVLALLGLLGVAALNSTDIEMMISANDRDRKNAFFYADSGVNVGSEMVEQAIELGVSPTPDTIVVTDPIFFMADRSWENSTGFNASSSSFGAYINGTQGTYVRIGGEEGFVPGSAAQIAYGYKGLGKGAAQGGGRVDYLIRSHRIGARNSVAEVEIGWRHIN